jgi:hypothetical protein
VAVAVELEAVDELVEVAGEELPPAVLAAVGEVAVVPVATRRRRKIGRKC